MSLAAPLAFTMLQQTRISKGSSIFWGNASLDGRLSHLLEGLNVTQVLPLEPPDAWARRQQDVTTYLLYFSQLVKLFSKERPINCEWYPRGARGWSRIAYWGTGPSREREPTGEREPTLHCLGTGTAFQGQLGKGMGTWPCAKPHSGQKELFCGARNFLLGAHPRNRVMLSLLLPLRK